jgi:hypothetical protein
MHLSIVERNMAVLPSIVKRRELPYRRWTSGLVSERFFGDEAVP